MTIDDFSVGPIVVERTAATAVTAAQSGLDPAHVVGGSRAIIVGESGSAGQALIIDAALGEMRFAVPSPLGYFTITYGSEAAPLNLDLTAEGHDRFILEIGSGSTSLNRVRIFTTNGTESVGGGHSVTTVKPLPSGGSLLSIPFSAYSSLDLAAVQRISLEYFRASPPGLVLKGLATIPEPNTASLIAIGAAALRRTKTRSGLRSI